MKHNRTSHIYSDFILLLFVCLRVVRFCLFAMCVHVR